MYEKKYTVLSTDTDPMRRLRLSRLFALLQEASIAHTTELGMGREKTLDKGLLWIITLQQAAVARLPVYDETVRLLSWPGDTMHVLFPRFYRIEDAKGNPLVEASALWTLMDKNPRSVVFPEEHGIRIRGERTGREPALPAAPKNPAANGSEAVFAVPFSYVDLNGHMNNTRYFDLAEDCMPAALRSKAVRTIRTEYSREAKLGEKLSLRGSLDGNTFLLLGETDGQKVFRMNVGYA